MGTIILIPSYKKRSEGFKSKDNPSPIKPTRSKTNEWSYGTTPERELTDSLTSSRYYLWENPKKTNTVDVMGRLCKLCKILETTNKEQDSSVSINDLK